MCKINKINLVEGIDVEFKSNFDFQNQDFVHQIYKTVRAFVNTNGGRLLIGVNDNCEIVGIRQEEIDKITRHLNDKFHNKVKLIAKAIMDTNNKWYLDFYIYESKSFIYEDKQENTICIRDNSCLKILKGNDIIDFWNKKSYCNQKINNFFKETCNDNLFIDWKYSINEYPNLNLKIDKFCNFFKMFWLKSQIVSFLNPELKHNFFNAIIFKNPIYNYFNQIPFIDKNEKVIMFQMDFFNLNFNSEIFSKYGIFSEKLCSITHIYSGSLVFKINKFFEIKEYIYKFDDALFETNIKNIKNNWLRNINDIDNNSIVKINKMLESYIIQNNKNFQKYSLPFIVDEIKKLF